MVEIQTISSAMPPEIAKAIIAVMAGVKKLGKEGDNKFAKYKYTSVDQFYEALGPLMAEHKIFDICLERSTSVEVRETVDDFGKSKKSAWLTAEYDFWLYHEGGSCFGPISRTQVAQATGAQSYASVQSYAEKYFLRNLFKVPTGDVDEVDASAQNGLPVKVAAPPPPIDWLKFKLALSACESLDAIQVRYDQLIAKYRPGHADLEEADALVREASAALERPE